MKIPKTPVEFDYDLWTSEDGKCMVRVKSTGEVSEVDHKVMKVLRAEEKRLRRALPSMKSAEDEKGRLPSVLYFEVIPNDEAKESAWLADPANLEDEVLTKMLIEEFCSELSAIQAAFFHECLLEGKEHQVFAAERGVERTTLWRWHIQFREKIIKIFGFDAT